MAGLALLGIGGLLVIAFGLSGALGPTPLAAVTTSSPAVRPSATHASPTAVPPAASAGPTSSAGPADPSPAASAVTTDPLLLGLLTESDLPGMSSPMGPREGTDFDIDTPAFDANDGIRVVSREWQSLADTGLAAVFDFRMQFPSEGAASAYLAAAEDVLSETAATGQMPVPSAPFIGTDSRVYGLERAGEGGTVLLRTYLFRVGTVAAKLVAGGPGVDAATTDRLAATAAARMRAAGQPAPGSPRPDARPSPTPAPTAPLPTGEALAALLLEHVPPHIAPACVPDGQRLWPGELATLACTDEVSGVTVTYSGFEGGDALQAAFEAALATIDMGGLADSCDQGPWLGGYQVEGEEVGGVACWEEQGGQAIMWSDGRLAILAVAVSPTLDPAGLYLWWLEAGPVP